MNFSHHKTMESIYLDFDINTYLYLLADEVYDNEIMSEKTPAEILPLRSVYEVAKLFNEKKKS